MLSAVHILMVTLAVLMAGVPVAVLREVMKGRPAAEVMVEYRQ